MARHLSRLRWLAIADLASVCAFGSLCVVLAARLVGAADDALGRAIGLLAVAPAWIFADLCSGIVHWVADRHFEEDTPVLGPLLIRPFREHHRDPQAMVGHGFLELSGNNCLICLPALSLLLALPPPAGGVALALQAGLLWACLAIFATNHIHRWAHAPHPPPLVRALQRTGLVLSPAHHARHHRRHDAAYCVTCGWLNPLLDGSGVLVALERRLPPRAPAIASPFKASPGMSDPGGGKEARSLGSGAQRTMAARAARGRTARPVDRFRSGRFSRARSQPDGDPGGGR